MRQPRTLSQKVWDGHVIDRAPGRADLIYIDFHLLHEVTSPQPFEGLRSAGRRMRRPELTLATADHDVPTDDRALANIDLLGRRQLAVQIDNCREFDVELHPLGSKDQGIVHVIGPQLGLTLPGTTVVCGDSHTATHGAFGAIAFGIGTSQVEHVLATQTLRMATPGTMSITVDGTLAHGVTAKDLILAIIAQVGTAGGTGTVLEFRGEAIEALSMEGRMTVCNMAIEAGARTGLVAPDDTTFAYLENRPRAPKGKLWEQALEDWRALHTDDDAKFDITERIDARTVGTRVTWGTDPSQNSSMDARVPDPADITDPIRRAAAESALEYMDLAPGTLMKDVLIDTVFIGSCTNGRIEDLHAVAEVVRGRKVAPSVKAIVVPGSTEVKRLAEVDGTADILKAAGFEWRSSGCSMCVGMNGDIVEPGKRSASTSNRNFRNRQGPGARTHLVSPSTAGATAIQGHLAAAEDLAR
ncbi:3-isopropylmalate dehydratase large subunit [Mycolicibacterium sp.]|uniref:3-isopropylmalate dehydratase large subunit n=1 Tax=Mycolicibacterium sp. TaxID=2320850 RepID=UPI0037C63642